MTEKSSSGGETALGESKSDNTLPKKATNANENIYGTVGKNSIKSDNEKYYYCFNCNRSFTNASLLMFHRCGIIVK